MGIGICYRAGDSALDKFPILIESMSNVHFLEDKSILVPCT